MPADSTGNRTAERNVAAIERAADVLFLFARSEARTLGVTEIASTLGISKAVVHRILSSLRDRDLVTLDEETRRYSLGPAVLVLADAYRDGLDHRATAVAAMRRLSETTGETATMSVLSGGQRVYVDQVTPPVEVKMTIQVGGSYPLHAGSSSKAFLAFMPPSERRRVLDAELPAVTDSTITSAQALEADLEAIRKRGYAVSLGEREAGAGSVAAPVFDHTGEPVMVLSVCGPIERFRDRVDELAKQLVAVTSDLSRQFGHQPV
ncbi:MAG: IclR family transcriptional regulator [Actinomycetia bacterium]|nr:IclR family transcriptional regulator [Actinomycetes bacterium]